MWYLKCMDFLINLFINNTTVTYPSFLTSVKLSPSLHNRMERNNMDSSSLGVAALKLNFSRLKKNNTIT